ncbi:MAG: TetR family transcriptional regulator [Pseudomonadota bacterium]
MSATNTQAEVIAARPQSRARSTLAKQARADLILVAAEKLFLSDTSRMPTVLEIARQANIAKGTVYLYFQTKEEIFLNVLQHHLQQWAEAVATALEATQEPLSPDGLIEAYLSYPLRKPVVMNLASLSSLALETNIPRDGLIKFKLAQIASLNHLAGLVVKSVKGWPTDLPARLFLQSHACLLGVWQLAEPPDACQGVLELPELRPLNVSFEVEARLVLGALWRASWPNA